MRDVGFPFLQSEKIFVFVVGARVCHVEIGEAVRLVGRWGVRSELGLGGGVIIAKGIGKIPFLFA